jgi:CheY-like chemotaxis protein
MVVEDNMINRKILVKILSTKLNIEVIEAEDGSAAVEKFRNLNSPAISMFPFSLYPMTKLTGSTARYKHANHGWLPSIHRNEEY